MRACYGPSANPGPFANGPGPSADGPGPSANPGRLQMVQLTGPFANGPGPSGNLNYLKTWFIIESSLFISVHLFCLIIFAPKNKLDTKEI